MLLAIAVQIGPNVVNRGRGLGLRAWPLRASALVPPCCLRLATAGCATAIGSRLLRSRGLLALRRRARRRICARNRVEAKSASPPRQPLRARARRSTSGLGRREPARGGARTWLRSLRLERSEPSRRAASADTIRHRGSRPPAERAARRGRDAPRYATALPGTWRAARSCLLRRGGPRARSVRECASSLVCASGRARSNGLVEM